MSNRVMPRLREHSQRVNQQITGQQLFVTALIALLLCAAMTLVAAARGRRVAVPAHIPPWAFDDGCSGGSGVASSLVRRWVSYAESNCGVLADKAREDCHGPTRVYCQRDAVPGHGLDLPR